MVVGDELLDFTIHIFGFCIGVIGLKVIDDVLLVFFDHLYNADELF